MNLTPSFFIILFVWSIIIMQCDFSPNFIVNILAKHFCGILYGSHVPTLTQSRFSKILPFLVKSSSNENYYNSISIYDKGTKRWSNINDNAIRMMYQMFESDVLTGIMT